MIRGTPYPPALPSVTRRAQDEVFVASEGNRWLERNAVALSQFDPSDDRIIRIFGWARYVQGVCSRSARRTASPSRR